VLAESISLATSRTLKARRDLRWHWGGQRWESAQAASWRLSWPGRGNSVLGSFFPNGGMWGQGHQGHIVRLIGGTHALIEVSHQSEIPHESQA
jgi:hypothetical protein